MGSGTAPRSVKRHGIVLPNPEYPSCSCRDCRWATFQGWDPEQPGMSAPRTFPAWFGRVRRRGPIVRRCWCWPRPGPARLGQAGPGEEARSRRAQMVRAAAATFALRQGSIGGGPALRDCADSAGSGFELTRIRRIGDVGRKHRERRCGKGAVLRRGLGGKGGERSSIVRKSSLGKVGLLARSCPLGRGAQLS